MALKKRNARLEDSQDGRKGSADMNRRQYNTPLEIAAVIALALLAVGGIDLLLHAIHAVQAARFGWYS